jgi:hypothetical protein
MIKHPSILCLSLEYGLYYVAYATITITITEYTAWDLSRSTRATQVEEYGIAVTVKQVHFCFWDSRNLLCNPIGQQSRRTNNRLIAANKGVTTPSSAVK